MRSEDFWAVFKSKTVNSVAVLFVVIASTLLTSCGSTSDLHSTSGAAVAPARKFARVTVQDFKLSAPDGGEKASHAKVYFADRIATELDKTHRFAGVARNGKPGSDTLMISGVITKYEEGSRQKRLWVGMGFGEAVVEANVEFRDGKGMKLGEIRVDKNTWPLGGWIAAAQGPEDLIEGAAEKIAEEATKFAR